MSRRVTIVMYHFVRNLRHARYPEIKGLDTANFAGQIAYIRRHYQVVSMEDVIAAARDSDAELPERALLLTFDDGYIDHYTNVFPLLDRYGLTGAFFPPARAILERTVLDVNKIHFLLATVPDKGRIVTALEAEVEAARAAHGLESLGHYRATYAHANRWDTAEVIYIKRMLQKALPEALRSAIIDRLFRQFVTEDETAFAEELYVSVEQLACMRRHGMHIGSHSYDHYWLDSLAPAEQEQQVRQSMAFLRELGCDMDRWVMCYPYGGYDASTLEILSRHGCAAGLTTELAIADLDGSTPLKLPRIDTNDLPRSADASPNEWTKAA